MRRNLIILTVVALLLAGAAALFASGVGTQLLWQVSKGGSWLLPLLAVAALVDSINPCAFSVLLLTIAFLLSMGSSRAGLLKPGGAYVAGIFVIYVAIGLGILQTLHLFNTPHFMAKVGASLLIVMGAINIINEFFPAFPIKLRIPATAHGAMARLMNRASLPAAFALGALVGLCEFPCTGGPYLMVLGLLHDQQTYAAGFGYLMLYNLIFIAPLIVLLLLASNEAILEKVQAWKRSQNRSMRLIAGVAMAALGSIIFFF